MMKLIRQTLCALTCLCLLNIQLSGTISSFKLEFGVANSFAQTQSQATVSSDGVSQVDQEFDLDKVDVGASGFLTLITMLGIGIITWQILISCKKQTMDMYIAAAAGAAYIMGEIMSYKDFKSQAAKQVEITVRADGQVNEEQLSALQQQRASYESVKGAAKKKITLQKAASVAFLAAAAMAGYKYFMAFTASKACKATSYPMASIPGFQGCAAVGAASEVIDGFYTSPGPSAAKGTSTLAACDALTASLGSCPPAATSCGGLVGLCKEDTAICAPKPVASKAEPGVIDFNNFFPGKLQFENFALAQTEDEMKVVEEYENRAEVVLKEGHFSQMNVPFSNFYKYENNYISYENYIVEREIMRFEEGKLSSITIDEYEDFKEGYDSVIVTEEDASSLFRVALSKGMDLLVPNANANPMAMLGITGAVAGILLGVMQVEWSKLDFLIASPLTRTMLWSGFAAFSLLAANTSQKVHDKAEENIAKIDAIIARLTGTATNQNLSNAVVPSSGTFSTLSSLLPSTGNTSQLISTDQVTPCLEKTSDGKCISFAKVVDQNKTEIQPLGTNFTNTTSDIAKMADGFQGTGTVSGATLDTASLVAGQQNAVNKVNRAIQRKINDEKKKNGEDPINFKGMTDKVTKAMLQATKKKLKSSGTSAKAVLGQLGLPSDISADKVAKEDDSKLKPTGVAAGAGGTGGTAVDLGKKKGGFDFDLDLEGDDTKSAVVSAPVEEEPNLDQYVEEHDDIVKDDSASIFDILSVRYLKSGYPKLLETEESNGNTK